MMIFIHIKLLKYAIIWLVFDQINLQGGQYIQ